MTPKEVSRLRILDPACGSGSFLIGAFDYLIDYHLRWYLDHPEQQTINKPGRGRQRSQMRLMFENEIVAVPDPEANLLRRLPNISPQLSPISHAAPRSENVK